MPISAFHFSWWPGWVIARSPSKRTKIAKTTQSTATRNRKIPHHLGFHPLLGRCLRCRLVPRSSQSITIRKDSSNSSNPESIARDFERMRYRPPSTSPILSKDKPHVSPVTCCRAITPEHSLLVSISFAGRSAEPTNDIVIYIDDMGYADIGHSGPSPIRPPI